MTTLTKLNVTAITLTSSLQLLSTIGNPAPAHEQENCRGKNTNTHTRPGRSTEVGRRNDVLNLRSTRHGNHCKGENTHPQCRWQKLLRNISLLEYNCTKRIHNERYYKHRQTAIGQGTTAQKYSQYSLLLA